MRTVMWLTKIVGLSWLAIQNSVNEQSEWTRSDRHVKFPKIFFVLSYYGAAGRNSFTQKSYLAHEKTMDTK